MSPGLVFSPEILRQRMLGKSQRAVFQHEETLLQQNLREENEANDKDRRRQEAGRGGEGGEE
jgi:hypothetical protein